MTNTPSRMILAAIILMSGISVAAATDTGMSKNTTSGSGASQAMAKDSLNLSRAQQKKAWKDISGQAAKETPPAGFSAKVGAVLPSNVGTQPVPTSTADKVPQLRPYQYALLDNNKLLIINPSDNKIAEVITQ